MKRTLLFTLLLIATFSAAANAQEDFFSSRLSNYANDLKRATVDLVDRTQNDMRRGGSLSRAAIEEAFTASQFDASAGLFQDMVSNRRSASELRDAAAILTDLSRRAPNYGSNSYQWRNVQSAVSNVNRELGGNGGGGNGGGGGGGGWEDQNRPIIGHVFWKGQVDDKVQLVIRGGTAETRVISGNGFGDGNYNFTSPFPGRNVRVGVDKKKGRGSVTVLQQPSKANDFTTVVEVYDNGSGARDYEVDIYWR